MMLEREMVQHDRMKSVGRVEVVVVSGEGLNVENTNKQPTKYKINNLYMQCWCGDAIKDLIHRSLMCIAYKFYSKTETDQKWCYQQVL